MRKLVSVALIVAIVGGAFALSMALKAMRVEPQQAPPKEARLVVDVVRLEPEDVPVVISGHGEARPLDVVSITPQVSGNVVYVHPNLELGMVIPAGETLFRIEPSDYEAAVSQARAMAGQARAGLSRVREQAATDKTRLDTLRRTRDLAQKEYDRAAGLFKESQVGALSTVEKAEMAANQARDAHDLLQQAINLYPLRISEAEEGAKAAEAALEKALLNLSRTEVKAEFNARVKEKRIEAGQFVGPGAPVITLANDSILEISVPLDSRDAAQWLEFDGENPVAAEKSWFGRLRSVPCAIRWTEDEKKAWTGTLNRVEKFDDTTRTVTVAVRVNSGLKDEGFPLVDGMFCKVEIPGKTMSGVFRLPRWAVTFSGEVYLAREGRLGIRPVTVVRSQGEDTFVGEGLAAGELAIVTRLVNPLPNSLLDFDAAAVLSSRASDRVTPAGDIVEEGAPVSEPEAAQ